MTITDDLKAEASSLGFCLAGVSLPTTPPHFPTFQNWLTAGRHGSMSYLANEQARLRRAHPELILPSVQSILSLAIRYPSPKEILLPIPTQPAGRIAAYAWGPDYHRLIPERLKSLIQKLGQILGRSVSWRGYTDTGPVLERDFAQSAGLGWIGKNTCLISPVHGSFFFLAEILLDVALEPDLPFAADRCGTCTRCIAACPTRCILPDRTIDATRCISYLTIENKGPIPPEMRPFLGNWIFGCDVCQMVCPWNQRINQTEYKPLFAPTTDIAFPRLQEELSLSSQEFLRKYQYSPVRRARRKGYLRNVAVAIGNSGDSGLVARLVLALENEPESLVRSHIAWALGQIGVPAATRALQKALQSEADEEVKAEILRTLENPAGQSKSERLI